MKVCAVSGYTQSLGKTLITLISYKTGPGSQTWATIAYYSRLNRVSIDFILAGAKPGRTYFCYQHKPTFIAMTEKTLQDLESALLKSKRQFADNYDQGAHSPYGSNASKRAISKQEYESAIWLAGSACIHSGIYQHLSSIGKGILPVNQLSRNSKPAGFLYDLNKLLEALNDIKAH